MQIYGWEPKPFKNWTELWAMEDAPQSLKDHVKSEFEKKEQSADVKPDEMVWITCEGENPADRENIGHIDYYPSQGIPSYYFPYLNQPGYLSPIVFAHLTNPQREYLDQRNMF